MITEKDKEYIKRCIIISKESLQRGDHPFGSIITKESKMIAQSLNNSKKDISSHAEMLVLRKAAKIEGKDLSSCTLYSNCEPCPMCSFMIREAKFRKIVFSLRSPSMGGLSKWNILTAPQLEQFPPYFSGVPEIIAGLHESEMIQYYDSIGWNEFHKKVGDYLLKGE